VLDLEKCIVIKPRNFLKSPAASESHLSGVQLEKSFSSGQNFINYKQKFYEHLTFPW